MGVRVRQGADSGPRERWCLGPGDRLRGGEKEVESDFDPPFLSPHSSSPYSNPHRAVPLRRP